jgi:hypothetical protein
MKKIFYVLKFKNENEYIQDLEYNFNNGKTSNILWAEKWTNKKDCEEFQKIEWKDNTIIEKFAIVSVF